MSDINRKGILDALGIKPEMLNNNAHDLLDDLMKHKSRYEEIAYINPLDYKNRIDYHKNGMLAEILKRTPVYIYDHPEIKREVNTAFVDQAGHMFFSDSFFKELMEEWSKGIDSISFLFGHEAEHLRRFHVARHDDSLPPGLQNAACDTRINGDLHIIEIMKIAQEKNISCVPFDPEFKKLAGQYFESIKGSKVIKSGHNNSIDELFKWKLDSEETIAAKMLKDYKEEKKKQPEELSFKDLCEAVAQDLDNVKIGSMGTPQDQADAVKLAKEVRNMGAKKGNLPKNDLTKILGDVFNTKNGQIGIKLNIASMPVNVPDKYIVSLRPTQRMDLLEQVINMKLNPSSGKSSDSDAIKIKDLDVPGGPSGDPMENHIISNEDLVKMLNEAGLSKVGEKLGIQDLAASQESNDQTRSNIVSSISKAAEEMNRVGASVTPGAHLIHYAMAQMNDLFKPVLSIKMRIKEMIEESSNKMRFAEEEPWLLYHMDHAELGFDSADDIPYMGSNIIGSATRRPLFVCIIDTSGSVSDGMLKRFISEAINAVRDNGHGDSPPECIIMFADTVARGEPLEINEDNYQEYIKKGVPYGGRGGTNFTASTQNVFKLFEEGERFHGRKLDGIMYLTDGFDNPPDQRMIEDSAEKAGFKRLPPMMFIVPEICYNAEFGKEISGYAELFKLKEDSLSEIDFNDVEENINSRDKRRDLN